MDINAIKELREKTGAGVMDAKSALEASDNNIEKALEFLKAKGIERAQKKSEREIKSGGVFSYTHNGRIAALVKIGCETDFVAKNEAFVALGNDLVKQVASMDPQSVEELLEQDYIKDGSKKIKDLVTEAISKIGENIVIAEIARLAI